MFSAEAHGVTETVQNLTPAGRQVERAIAEGYPIAAANLYYFNLRENVPMVEGDEPSQVSVWHEWHRMIQTKTGMDDAPVIGEEGANTEADKLGLAGEDRAWFIAERIDELNDLEPTIVEETERNINGEVTGTKLVRNPRLGEE